MDFAVADEALGILKTTLGMVTVFVSCIVIVVWVYLYVKKSVFG